ncbi:hypothetical protein [Opitutus terrae]|uniref:Uncharacterized protein n=1 Tax=Opitutus terrae (strain DSM 11246 / JCM 15787 / PB90-1) TaxID=452637 RepID=B1ZQJ1_OPITP|nr:hypothetical protein [Opitutus terrae]ACB75600.1 hypothetical protein Oter_2318 [Opitutus terrae PB90-1]
MSLRFRPISLLWTIVPVCAVGFLLWLNAVRIERVQHVSAQPDWSVDIPAEDASSPTGYAGGTRRHIVPGPNQPSYDWIAQTQQMLASHSWRLHRVDTDNAPFGCEVHAASPYRWWLALIATMDHWFSGKPLGVSVERAALVADPLLQLLLLITVSLFVGRQLGGFAGAATAAGIAAMFPFATGFLAGAPNSVGLAEACGLWSLLLLLPAVRPGVSSDHASRWWFAAGVAGACSVWIRPLIGVAFVGGVAAGGVIAALLERRSSAPPPPWRAWSAGGAAMILAAFLVEYFPSEMDPARLEVIHPLYGLAWLGAGELLATLAGVSRLGVIKTWSMARKTVAATGAITFVVACAVFASRESGFWNTDPLASQLTGLGDGIAAPGLADWLRRDGLSRAALATLLPAAAILAGLAVTWRRLRADGWTRGVAVLVGGALVTLAVSSIQLRAWMTLDSFLILLLAVLAGSVAVRSVAARLLGGGVLAVVLWPGLLHSLPDRQARGAAELTSTEVRAVIHRDLAHWLALRSDRSGAIALASPELTTALIFHGGLRGIGTLRWENREGFLAAARIASATSMDEALLLLERRAVRYLVAPTWDASLDSYVTLGLNAAPGSPLHEKSLVASLRRWALPPWLRPVPYSLPPIAGYESEAVRVFEVQQQQEPLASSRLAEYFVETEQLELAAGVREKLLRYPANLGALVARAQVERVRNDTAGFERTLEAIARALERGGDRRLPWERRVNLAIVLAQAKHFDPARAQLDRCLAEANATELRTLSTGALFRLLALCKFFKVEIGDPQLRELAHALLPPELRQRLATKG